MHSNSPPLSTVSVANVTTLTSSDRTVETSDPSCSSRLNKQINTDTLPFEIPDGLESILTTTRHPSEVYATVQNSRDRRFRLLLRRFTNQIQYGCRNPRCDVPTCLSYRKRIAGAPIRSYSDVAARALAWRCVEQYATGNMKWGNGNTLDDETFATKSKRSKGKAKVRYCGDGLCRSDPVVPWYEDPSEHLWRRNAGSSKNVTVRPQAQEKARTLNSGYASRSDGSYVDPELKSRTGNGKTIEATMIPANPSFENEPQELREEKSLPNTDQTIAAVTGHLENNEHQPTYEDSGLDTRLRRAKTTDNASFTQFLYNLPVLKKFDSTRHHAERIDSQKSSVANPSSPQKSEDSVEGEPRSEYRSPVSQEIPEHQISSHQATSFSGTTSNQHVHTFSLLPARAIAWLRAALLLQPSRNADFSLKRNSTLTSLDEFASQSLHFVLSHPLRLIRSAESWRNCSGEQIQYLKQGLTYSEPGAAKTLNDIFRNDTGVSKSEVSLPTLPSCYDMDTACDMLLEIVPELPVETISNHLFAALQYSYSVPSRLRQPQSPDRDSERSTSGALSDRQTAQLLLLVMACVASITTDTQRNIFQSPSKDFGIIPMGQASFNLTRNTGQVFPYGLIYQRYRHWSASERTKLYRDYIEALNWYHEPHISRLFECITDIISHRKAVSMTSYSTKSIRVAMKKAPSIIELIIAILVDADFGKSGERPTSDKFYTNHLFDCLLTVLLVKWDRKAVINRIGPVGGAFQMLAGMYRARQQLDLPAESFQLHFVADSLDEVDMPFDWLSFREDSRRMHVLSFAFLFEPAMLVKYFRAINIKIMQHAHENALIVYANAKQHLFHPPISVYGTKEILAKTRPHMARYLVLTIQRQNVLEDAINQVWRRERQELMRPLKVKIGKDEGEDGLDHGGVQQEFFRLAFAEALDVKYGMFTIDETTRMTWFQPESIEPAYKFEALGILMSLAVYNAVTLPVTFPVAFYRKILNLKVKKIEHISDGWPALAKGLGIMLDWKDGDVGEIMARTYEYSYEVFGKTITIDMERVGRDDLWPRRQNHRGGDRTKTASFEFPPSPLGTPPYASPPCLGPQASFGSSKLPSLGVKGTSTPSSLESENHDIEPSLVTNNNREQYIKDYIFWLTDKSIRPQYEAFAKGFYTCLDRTALSIFTPEALKKVVEGHQEIDIDGLERTASYDDYETNEQIIQDFWSVVRDFSPEQHRKLLEFVTASDRVPVNGIESITFIIQRNGEGDSRLPSSSTCYGRLLLPHYTSKEVLRIKLEKAIENSVGFGSL